MKLLDRGIPLTALQVKLKWEKNIQSTSRLLRERSHLELQNQPPLDGLVLPSPNLLMASLWIRSGERLARRGFGDGGPDHRVGAHFEALDEGVLVAVLKSIGYFFSFYIYTEEQKYSI